MTSATKVKENVSVEPISWRSYYELCKPKVVYLIVFTGFVGMLLANPGGLPPLDILIAANLGIGLAAASGAALNHMIDQRIDALMHRTENRPLPSGRLDTLHVFFFAVSLGILAMAILVAFVNDLTAFLTFIALIGYAVIYTVFLKRNTPQNIVLGGAAGAAPPLLGWAAVTGEVGTEALLLFLIIFVWTPPHFWALAIRRRKEYAKAKIPMLPVTHGVPFTKEQILLYTLLLFTVSLMPVVIQMSGLIYLSGAVALGIGFIYYAWRLYRDESDALAMKTFGYSIFYLSLLFAFLLADHYVREFFRAFVI
ncbi:MAG: protoheme IX farnesyltransferase [Gammaproteobacteria bacterium]|nr:heme o synthase [Gammaproteobacteria bacterium]NNJ90154.1 protoheme IX farnesyltransferase [Gammaproteobacteria bacterium]